MTYYVTHDKNYRVTVTNQQPAEGKPFVTSETIVDPNDYYYKDNQIHTKPANSDPFGVFDVDTQTWSTDSAAAWASLRFERNALLNRSDWTQSPDSPLSNEKRQEWAAYRTLLRTLPERTSDPASDVQWPTEPSS